jgi:uncharacterized protein YndB with AHSA1/START domain
MNAREEYVVRKKITLNAKPSEVWGALTNPEKTKKYFFGCRVYSSWKEGSPITFKGKILRLFNIELNGKILKIEPGKILKYTLGNRGSSSFSTVTDELIYENGKTTLVVTDNVGEGKGAEKRFKRSVKGWNKVLRGLKELVEKNRFSK